MGDGVILDNITSVQESMEEVVPEGRMDSSFHEGPDLGSQGFVLDIVDTKSTKFDWSE